MGELSKENYVLKISNDGNSTSALLIRGCNTSFYGYSEENKLVNFTGEKIQAGDFVKVKITGTKSYTLDGEKII